MEKNRPAVRDFYKFKHNGTVMMLRAERDSSFNLLYAPTLRHTIFEKVLFLLSFIFSGFVALVVGERTYSSIAPEKEATSKHSVFEIVDKAQNSVNEFGATVAAIFIGANVFILLVFVLTILSSILLNGLDHTLKNFAGEDVDEIYSVHFNSDIQPYLHLLNPESLYTLMKKKEELRIKELEDERLLSYSTQLQNGFLKDEVISKKIAIAKERRILKEEISQIINDENDRLMVISNAESKLRKNREYKKLEEMVLKDISA